MKSHGYPVEENVQIFRDSKDHVADLQVARAHRRGDDQRVLSGDGHQRVEGEGRRLSEDHLVYGLPVGAITNMDLGRSSTAARALESVVASGKSRELQRNGCRQ
jgi:hypothetical protein